MNKTELTQRLYEADLINTYAITGSQESYLFMTNQNGEGYYWINHNGETLGFIKEDLDRIYSEAKEYGLSDKNSMWFLIAWYMKTLHHNNDKFLIMDKRWRIAPAY